MEIVSPNSNADEVNTIEVMMRSSVASKLRSGATFLGGDLVASRPWVTTQLAGYVTTSTLTSTLAGYVTTSTLTSSLSTKADLVGGVVPASQLPSYVDDVLEFANLAAFPGTGETGKIYVDLATGRTYRWSGSAYIELTDTTAVWGSISGTLSNQTDLQNALNAKFNVSGGTLTGGIAFSGSTNPGVRLANLTSAQIAALPSPQAGIIVWDTDLARVRVHNGTTFTSGFVRLDGDTMSGGLIATSLETRNGGTATEVIVNNTRTDGSNYERGYARWNGNVFRIGTDRLGTGQQRALHFETDGTLRLRIEPTLPIISLGTGSGRAVMQSFSGTNAANASDGTGLAFIANTTVAGDSSFAFTGSSFATTSGTNRFVDVFRTFNPTSGTAVFNAVESRPTINQTGGASGATRSFNAAPILTAAVDWRSFDTNVNTGFAYHSSGTAPSRFGGVVQFPVLTVSTLPVASTVPRGRAFVSDSTLALNGTNLASTLTGGGANFVPVYSDGTNWRIG